MSKVNSMSRVALVVGMCVLVLSAGNAQAFNPQPDPPGQWRFGLVKFADGLVARLAVAHLGGPDTARAKCGVSVSFVDDQGNELLPAVQKVIAPGGALVVDLPFEKAFPNPVAGAENHIRPVVATFCDGSVRPSRRFSGPYAPSLQILDARGGQVLHFIGAPEFLPAVQRLR